MHPSPCLPGRLGATGTELTLDPDNGAAPGPTSLTLISPTILRGGTCDDQLGTAALVAQLAPGRWPQHLPILGPVHGGVRSSGLTREGQVLAFCDCGIYELPGKDARLLWGKRKEPRVPGAVVLLQEGPLLQMVIILSMSATASGCSHRRER